MVASLLYYHKFTKESGECRIQNQSIWSVHSKQDCRWHTNDNMLSCGWLQIKSPQQQS
jgi:hypothetical protein